MTQLPNKVSARRVTLMASVAGLGLAVLLTGPGAFRAVNGPAWTGTALAAENMLQPTGFADIVAKVKPAVISVRVRMDAEKTASLEDNEDNGQNGQMQPGAPLDRFFKQFGFKQFGMPDGAPNGMAPRSRPVNAEGSGFFISADGYAVTNNHVVDHAKTVQIVTDDGRIMPAKVIGTDPKTDLALIKVEGSDFPFVHFADRDPRIGDWVIAVGNPFGLGGTVTAGVVSARGRDIGAGPYDDFIQIDAPVNKGNSGGPTFDVNGNVIGVNTAIFSPSGGSVGIGFDIPADTVKTVVAQLKDHGHVTRGWIGVQIQPVTADIADSLGLKKAEGALVSEPQNRQPGRQGGDRRRRRHHHARRSRSEGRPCARSQDRHHGARHLGEARRPARRQREDRDASRSARFPMSGRPTPLRRAAPRTARRSSASRSPRRAPSAVTRASR